MIRSLTHPGLTTRILLVILAMQGVLFVALASARINGLKQEIAAETRLAVQTARSLVLASLGTMQGAVPADRVMAQLPDRLVPPRHTRIVVLDARDGTLREPAQPEPIHRDAPDWFVALIAPDPLETRLPVLLDGQPRGFVHILGDPAPAIAQAWDQIRATMGLVALAAAAQIALILLATWWALRPVGLIAARLDDLRRGDLTARVGPIPQPDLSPIAAGVDDLAQALQTARSRTARLQRQVIQRGDSERKAIARDLHDEMGPCLFGLRVELDALRGLADTPELRAHADAIAAVADEIARVHRALLDDLRPAAIGQLPLKTVLTDYLQELRPRAPEIRLDLELPPDLPEPDEPTALTLFRILQEGTTNALRHSGARRIAIRLWTEPGEWRMMLSDDGQGFAEGSREGTGLTGMRERITALGGTLRLSSTRTGTTIEARLPGLGAPEGPTG